MDPSLHGVLRVALSLMSTTVILIACQQTIATTHEGVIEPEVASGGLGLTRDEWRRRYGPEHSASRSSAFFSLAFDPSAYVAFTEIPVRGQVLTRTVQIHLARSSRSEDEVRDFAMTLLPRDAVFVEKSVTYVERSGWFTTDRLFSESLARLSPGVCASTEGAAAEMGEIHLTHRATRKGGPPFLVDVIWACYQ